MADVFGSTTTAAATVTAGLVVVAAGLGAVYAYFSDTHTKTPPLRKDEEDSRDHPRAVAAVASELQGKSEGALARGASREKDKKKKKNKKKSSLNDTENTSHNKTTTTTTEGTTAGAASDVVATTTTTTTAVLTRKSQKTRRAQLAVAATSGAAAAASGGGRGTVPGGLFSDADDYGAPVPGSSTGVDVDDAPAVSKRKKRRTRGHKTKKQQSLKTDGDEDEDEEEEGGAVVAAPAPLSSSSAPLLQKGATRSGPSGDSTSDASASVSALTSLSGVRVSPPAATAGTPGNLRNHSAPSITEKSTRRAPPPSQQQQQRPQQQHAADAQTLDRVPTLSSPAPQPPPPPPPPPPSSQLCEIRSSVSLTLDTDGSWTYVDANSSTSRRHRRRELETLGASTTLSNSWPAIDMTSSDVASTTSDSPSSSSLAERMANAANVVDMDMRRKRVVSDAAQRTLAEKLVPKPRKTGIEDMLEQSDVPALARVMRVRPRLDDTPVPGFSWDDYGDVTEGEEDVDSSLVHDADQEDEGEWGIVKSRTRNRPTQMTTTTTMTTTPTTGSTSLPGTMTKKQRQNARRRELAKSAKADAEATRLEGLAKHKRELERLRIIEQSQQGGGKKRSSGGMQAIVDGQGKLVWE